MYANAYIYIYFRSADLTLKVGPGRMPIIRAENFTDVTVDLPFDKLPLLVVGNENNSGLKRITLQEYLENIGKYCDNDKSVINLYDKRDANVLTSCQACVLPIAENKVEFGVDVYNYQSRNDEPAVLVIMATAYGTSAQVVCGGNKLLYFNDNNISRLFKAERITDYRASQGKPTDQPMSSEEKALNGIYIFQVPLVIKEKKTRLMYDTDMCLESLSEEKSVPRGRGMERAILTLGTEKGPYLGIKKSNGGTHELKRDVNRPIRLTVQFYMCTDSIDIPDNNIKEIADQIRQIYDKGLNEGSLVVNSQSKPGLKVDDSVRPTATSSEKVFTFLDNGII